MLHGKVTANENILADKVLKNALNMLQKIYKGRLDVFIMRIEY